MYGKTPYIPLWCHSHYSFQEGASSPEELVERAAALGLDTVALTDRDGLFGAVEAHCAARRLGIRLLLGAVVTTEDGVELGMIVRDKRGYANLCTLLSTGHRSAPKGRCRIPWSVLRAHGDGLICLVDPGAVGRATRWNPDLLVRRLRAMWPHDLYLALRRHYLATDADDTAVARHLGARHRVPVVAANRVLYHDAARKMLQDAQYCLRHRIPLAQAGTALTPNDRYALLSPDEHAALFADLPEAVAATHRIAQSCTFTLDDCDYRYPAGAQPGVASWDELAHRTWEGARTRYPRGVPSRVRTILNRELSLVKDLDLADYFLTMHDIVRFCASRDILCQGRGSAANSAICFCLGITAVDPDVFDVLFERFLSKERCEPPDIDLDIEHHRREEVIQYVYRTWGRDHAAMVAVFARYRPKMAVRDAGFALGIPEPTIARVSAQLDRHGTVEERAFADAGLASHPPVTTWMRLANALLGVPRHLSTHPGGFLISRSPLSHLVPVVPAAQPGRTIIQWDKDHVESLGWFKMDLLGLGALHLLHRCIDLVAAHHHTSVDLAALPKDDPATFAMIRKGDTLGVFQIESRAQMAMLPRLRPRTFYDLVIQISIVRPGPITGDMVHPYLRRRNKQEPVTYPHPSLAPILSKTLGVPLFQEQVMRIAMTAADYTPGEADQLRRDMGAWRHSGRLEAHRDKLVSRMTAKGIAPEFAERIFSQIRGFGEYGFPESHAVSFALISYACAYLRCHYPAAYTCALLNAQPMGFYSPATIVEDAKRHGVSILPIDITASQWDCTLEQGAIRMGLRFVRGLAQDAAQQLLAARAASPFTSVDDAAQRARLDQRSLRALARAGALRRLQPHRRAALWNASAHRLASQPLLSAATAIRDHRRLPSLPAMETAVWDRVYAHHNPHRHPVALLRTALFRMRLLPAVKITPLPDGARAQAAGLVLSRQRPSTANGVVFFTLEDETGFVNVVCSPHVYEAHRAIAKSAVFLAVGGRIQRHDGVVHLVADTLWVPAVPAEIPRHRSRDFR